MSHDVTRRAFVAAAVGGVAANVRIRIPLPRDIKAVAFDALAIFDPTAVAALAGEMLGAHGAAVMAEWRTRQFEYTWLRVAAGRYADFEQVTSDALTFAAKKVGVVLSATQRDALTRAYSEMTAWPDVAPALESLRHAGLRLALLSNFTSTMLESNIRHARLDGIFQSVLSTDQARTYKPDPRGYRIGTETLRLDSKAILFVPSAGWDAAGAKLFGYPTFWVNRSRLPSEELGPAVDGSGPTLDELVRFIDSMPS